MMRFTPHRAPPAQSVVKGIRIRDKPVIPEKVHRLPAVYRPHPLLPAPRRRAPRKLFWSESAQRHYGDTLDVLGADGVLAPGAAGAPAGGVFEQDFRAAVVTTVYGGASEILREIIAERRLGLPRNRPAS